MIEIFGELVAKQIAKHLNYKSTRDAPKVAPDGRPVALFGELSVMADRAEETLLAAKVPFYQRGKILVRPVITRSKRSKAGPPARHSSSRSSCPTCAMRCAEWRSGSNWTSGQGRGCPSTRRRRRPWCC